MGISTDKARITIEVILDSRSDAVNLESVEEALCQAMDSHDTVRRYGICGEWLEGHEVGDMTAYFAGPDAVARVLIEGP